MKVSFVGKSLIALASLLLTAHVAFAAECDVPQFNAQQHTYMSSALQQDSRLQAKLDGLSAELVSAGTANGHQITPYFVACQMNYRDGIPGVELSHKISEQWKLNAAFPSQGQVVVITWVRNGLDTSHGSVAAFAGQSLQELGFTGDFFASEGGPVLGDIRQFMPNNPKGEFVHIISQVGHDIDAQKAEAIRQAAQDKQDAIDSAARAEFMSASVPYVLGLVVLALLAWLALRLWKLHAANEKARVSIRKKDARVTTLLQQVEADFGTVLAKQGIASATHVTAVASLLRRQEEIRQQLRSNPLGTQGASRQLLTEAESLQQEVLRSVELQTIALPALELNITHVRDTTARTRQSVVTYSFRSMATPAGLSSFFELQVKGGNPDEEIALALASIVSARASLTDGKVDEAQNQLDAAGTYVNNADAIVKNTLAAKAGSETIVATILEARTQLLRDCEGGNAPLQQLGLEFAPVNFEDVVNNIEKAKTTAQQVDGVIAQAAAQYFLQDFLAAKARLDGMLHDLDAAKTGVSDISARLNDLTKKRATLLLKVAETGQTLKAVDTKFQSNRSHASSRTKQGYETLQEQQRRLSQVSSDNTMINWLIMYALYETFTSGAHTVSSHIDSDRSSYESAQRSAAAASYASTQSASIDTSSISSMGSSGGGNY